MEQTSITMVRHGETEWNIAMRLQGMQNSNLTPKGILQAKQAGLALQDDHFDCLISSDLQRALDTAKLINKNHGLEILKDASLRERNFGIMEGLTREEILDQFPETYHAYMNRKDEYQIPEGESLVNFFDRVTNGINQIAKENSGKKLLIVTHGGVLDCMMRMLFDIPLDADRKYTIYNASVNRFVHSERGWMLETWGNIDFQKGELVSIDEPSR